MILAIVILIGYIKEYVIISLSMFLHEAAHITAACIIGKKIYEIRVLPVGFNADIGDNDLCNSDNILIYAAGPALNFILATGGFFLNTYYLNESNDMLFFISSNLYLAIFNLLPIIPMDGGRILKEVLWNHVGLFSAKRRLKLINRVMSALFIILGAAQFISSAWNFSLIIIGFYVFFSFNEERVEVPLMNMKSIIYRRARLLKKGVYQVRDIVAIKSVRMSHVLKHMDFDRFHIIYVLDEELNVLKVMTEKELLDGLLKYNSEITFEEFLELGKFNSSM